MSGASVWGLGSVYLSVYPKQSGASVWGPNLTIRQQRRLCCLTRVTWHKDGLTWPYGSDHTAVTEDCRMVRYGNLTIRQAPNLF